MERIELTNDEKYEFLKDNVYEYITHSVTGKLLINTKYCRIAAKLLGGNYDELTKNQKQIFKSDLVDERLYIENSFDKYTRH